jgi:hypothetical protein
MDKAFIEDIARAMHRQHSKEMFGAIQKWEKANPGERSTWRLIARTVIARIQAPAASTKRKPSAKA